MQSKTAMRYHLTPVRMAIINMWWMWWKGDPFALLVGIQVVQPLWKAVWRYLKKLKIDLPFDPVIPLLGIYLKEPKMLIQKNISSSMFIAALFTIAKIWKQPKCPSLDEWIKQLWDIYRMEYYSVVKKKKNLPLQQYRWTWITDAKWDKPVRERQIPYDFTHMWNLMNKLN